jgi:sugar phosphate isomerase/epimerase
MTMQLGLMNNPARDVLKEIARATEFGFDFLDLTLEPPAARADRVNAEQIRSALAERGLGVIGHTAYYLPFASAFDAIRVAAVHEAERCLEIFGGVGAPLMNIHLDCRVPGHDIGFINAQNVESLRQLLPTAERLGIGLMVENAEGDDADALAPVFDALPTVGLHLDIGHANIGAGRRSHTASLLARYAGRLKHVHLSDNKGRSDDHLAIGAGTIDWRRELRTLKASGYDGTITLETFYGDSSLISYSMNRVRELWTDL